MRTIENLKTENKELKQLLKESLGPIADQIQVINKKIGKEKFADDYHFELCQLHGEIKGMIDEQQKS
jgi:hypothetical protein